MRQPKGLPTEEDCLQYSSWLYEECREYDLKGMPQLVKQSLEEIHSFTEEVETIIITDDNGRAQPDFMDHQKIKDLNRDLLVGAIWHRAHKILRR